MYLGIKIGLNELNSGFLHRTVYDEEKRMERPTHVSLTFILGGRTFVVDYKVNPDTLKVESWEHRVPLTVFTRRIFNDEYPKIPSSLIEWAIRKTLSPHKGVSPP